MLDNGDVDALSLVDRLNMLSLGSRGNILLDRLVEQLNHHDFEQAQQTLNLLKGEISRGSD